jgi:hypothetical protein
LAALEALKAAAMVRGLAPAGLAKVVQVEWFGDQAVKVTYEDTAGGVRNRLVYRNEPQGPRPGRRHRHRDPERDPHRAEQAGRLHPRGRRRRGGFAHEPRYVRRPFQREPDFGATCVTYKIADLLARAEAPG